MIWTDSEIEDLYRRYHYNQSVLMLLEPSITSQLRMDKASGGTEYSKMELMAIRRAQANIDIKIVEACLRFMNQDEREYINLRYNEDLDVKIVSGCMRCSVEKVYYLKRRVIKKTRKLLTL